MKSVKDVRKSAMIELFWWTIVFIVLALLPYAPIVYHYTTIPKGEIQRCKAEGKIVTINYSGWACLPDEKLQK